MEVVYQILNSVASLSLPTGFSFGTFIVFIWSIPLLPRLFKSIF